MTDEQKTLSRLSTELSDAWSRLQLDQKLLRLKSLEHQASEPELWSDPDHAKSVNQELSKLSAEVAPWQLLKAQTTDLAEILELNDPELTREASAQLASMQTTLENLKKELRFTGQYDDCDAILRITAGVGGTEAMDWASMLERMYLRFFEKSSKNSTTLQPDPSALSTTPQSSPSTQSSTPSFTPRLIERQPGEEAGIKTAVYEISGPHAYGTLKSEHGVHRLVRLSPFNADNLRQTSFALVEILPKINNDTDVKIDDKDLRIDVYHSSGHGGQGVNTTDSAVRITHLPTGIVVAIQNERSQHANKDTAMNILKAKLVQMQQEQHAASIGELRAGESAKWGQQIRNYVLQPYQLVKDTRTKYEEKDASAVLDGKISGFIDAYLESHLGKAST